MQIVTHSQVQDENMQWVECIKFYHQYSLGEILNSLIKQKK